MKQKYLLLLLQYKPMIRFKINVGIQDNDATTRAILFPFDCSATPIFVYNLSHENKSIDYYNTFKKAATVQFKTNYCCVG